MVYYIGGMKEDRRKEAAMFTPYSSSTSSLGYCNICCNRYDQEEYKPLLICQNDHSVCRACLRTIIRKPRCPFCRTAIDLHRIRLNRQALLSLNK
jgi:hypothetical protein